MSTGWARWARNSRDALALLGHPVGPRCLPDEAEPCGGDFAVHTVAHLLTLAAIIDHQLTHLNPPAAMTADIHDHAAAECIRECRYRDQP